MLLRKVVITDYPKICDLVITSFLKYEPMCNVLKIKEEDFIYSFQNLIKACCSHDFSSVIEDTENAKLIATSLACPYNVYENIKIPEDNSDEINKILLILDLCDKNNNSIYDKERTIYHFIVGTNPDYINNGLSRKVINETIKFCKNSNYNFIIADATNIVSQHILQKHFDYKQVSRIKYSDHECFKNIKDTEYIVRMIKDI